MKKIISVLLPIVMIFSVFATVNAANELAGARNYSLGGSKSGSILEGNESDIYKFTLPISSKINMNYTAGIERSALKIYDENAFGCKVDWIQDTQTVVITK